MPQRLTVGYELVGVNSGVSPIVDLDQCANCLHVLALPAVESKREPLMNAGSEPYRKCKPAKILVVEDQFLLASQLARILEGAGFTVIGPVSRVADGLRTVYALDGQLDSAILDVDLAGERSDPIAEELSRRGIPFIFGTVHDRQVIAARFATQPRIRKPYEMNNLFRVLPSIIKVS